MTDHANRFGLWEKNGEYGTYFTGSVRGKYLEDLMMLVADANEQGGVLLLSVGNNTFREKENHPTHFLTIKLMVGGEVVEKPRSYPQRELPELPEVSVEGQTGEDDLPF